MKWAGFGWEKCSVYQSGFNNIYRTRKKQTNWVFTYHNFLFFLLKYWYLMTHFELRGIYLDVSNQMWFCLLLSHPTKPFLTCKFVAVWKPKAVTAILMWLLLYVATVNQIWSNHTHTVLMKLFYNKYTGKKVSQASATLLVHNFAMGVICKNTEIWRL